MSISANNMSNALIKTYLSKINSENGMPVTSNSSSVDQEKLVQQMAFQMVLQQMMSSMNNSMMEGLISTALEDENSTGIGNSLSLMSNLNLNSRTANINNPVSANSMQTINSGLGMLGIAASKYESNLNPGAISNNPGDFGGKSYGAWQFSSKTGSLNSFINWLSVSNNEYYTELSKAKAKDGNSYGENFDAAWMELAKNDEIGFLKLQQEYIGQAYYNKAAESLKSKYNFDIAGKSDALKESLWSTVVQHGVGGTLSIFSKLNLNNSDRSIINDLYNERQKVNTYFRSSSDAVKQSVYNRFTREKADMLSMLDSREV
jgi:hypothetical protein